MIRARAMAAGVALPRAGSFNDAVLQAMLSREQNLRFTEVSLLTRMLERVVGELYELTTKPDVIDVRRKALSDDVGRNLKVYESELYQDRYAASYVREERERTRAEQQAAFAAKEKQAELLEKVRKFGDDG